MSYPEEQIMSHQSYRSTAAVILAGGWSTRLGNICRDTPKAMLPIHGHPFLAYVVTHCLRNGLSSVTILAGHMGNVIVCYFSQYPWTNQPVHVVLDEPGGTATDLLKGIKSISSTDILVLLGDVLVNIPLNDLILYHYHNLAPCNIVLTRLRGVPNEDAFLVGENNLVLFSHESSLHLSQKMPGDDQIFWKGSSTGVSIFRKDELLALDDRKYRSLEKEVLPDLIRQHKVMAFDNKKRFFLDFGVPERYHYLQSHSDEVIKIYGQPSVF